MKRNIGLIDRIVRAVLGIGFIVLAVTVSWWFVVGALVMIPTAVVSSCPLYQVLDISTCHIKEDPEK
ncbi:MAG: DUF2892 domain-containing protein [Bacilli bacterium]|nr:DUF2892 domain-containing protein [Bacilli bacterium]MBN2697159.1 DUF2892 domain-containing protein [Bacilli bacterium]